MFPSLSHCLQCVGRPGPLLTIAATLLSACERSERTVPSQPIAPEEPPLHASPESVEHVKDAVRTVPESWQILAKTCRGELKRLQDIDRKGDTIGWQFKSIGGENEPSQQIHVIGRFIGLPADLKRSSSMRFVLTPDIFRSQLDSTSCDYENTPFISSLRTRINDVIEKYAEAFLGKRASAKREGSTETVRYQENGLRIYLRAHYEPQAIKDCLEGLDCLSGISPSKFGADVGKELSIFVDNERLDKPTSFFHKKSPYFIPPR